MTAIDGAMAAIRRRGAALLRGVVAMAVGTLAAFASPLIHSWQGLLVWPPGQLFRPYNDLWQSWVSSTFVAHGGYEHVFQTDFILRTAPGWLLLTAPVARLESTLGLSTTHSLWWVVGPLYFSPLLVFFCAVDRWMEGVSLARRIVVLATAGLALCPSTSRSSRRRTCGRVRAICSPRLPFWASGRGRLVDGRRPRVPARGGVDAAYLPGDHDSQGVDGVRRASGDHTGHPSCVAGCWRPEIGPDSAPPTGQQYNPASGFPPHAPSAGDLQRVLGPHDPVGSGRHWLVGRNLEDVPRGSTSMSPRVGVLVASPSAFFLGLLLDCGPCHDGCRSFVSRLVAPAGRQCRRRILDLVVVLPNGGILAALVRCGRALWPGSGGSRTRVPTTFVTEHPSAGRLPITWSRSLPDESRDLAL